MKKIFAILLIFICIFSLVACKEENKETISAEEFFADVEPILGAGYDNPKTSFDPDYEYYPLPENFEIVPDNKCGIVFNVPYVFQTADKNHVDRGHCHSIIFREDGVADIYINDVYLYTTMGGAYQYGKGKIFDIVTGTMIYVRSETEISLSQDGHEYIGTRKDNTGFHNETPSLDDKYVCIKDGVTYAYQFKEDYTVDYYENYVLIETIPYYGGWFAVGLRGSVYCLSTDKVALFMGDDIFTLGGIEYTIPQRNAE